jgi:hypothetical protein
VWRLGCTGLGYVVWAPGFGIQDLQLRVWIVGFQGVRDVYVVF